VIRQV